MLGYCVERFRLQHEPKEWRKASGIKAKKKKKKKGIQALDNHLLRFSLDSTPSCENAIIPTTFTPFSKQPNNPLITKIPASRFRAYERVPLHHPPRIPNLQAFLLQMPQLNPVDLLPRPQIRTRGARHLVRQLDANARVENGIAHAPTYAFGEIEVGHILRAVWVELKITGRLAAAIFDAVEQARGARIIRPALKDDPVSERMVATFVPGWAGFCGVVRVLVDVTDFGGAIGI